MGSASAVAAPRHDILRPVPMEPAEKVREIRLRRMAERRGLRLSRSRRRDPLAIDYGMYYLIDDRRDGEVVAQGPLDDVEAYLTRSR